MRTASNWIRFAVWLAVSAAAWGQTFGKVVAIGGSSADLALDESRHVLYVANFTANRIEVISTDTGALDRSINVASQPSSLALSPDGKFLVVAHYGNFVAPSSTRNALTVIDLSANSRQTFSMPDPPLGVAFGIDGKALVVTTTQFLLFDPALGSTDVIETIAGVTAKTLPQPPANYPTQIVGASVAASADGMHIYGVTDQILFAYDIGIRDVRSGGYVASPPLGPRAISVSRDGSYYLAGWALWDRKGILAQFPNPSGALNIGSHAIDSERNIIYAQVPEGVVSAPSGPISPASPAASQPADAVPFLMVVDADNLDVRARLRLPENLSGKGVMSSDGQTMYALSESGAMILPVGAIAQSPQLTTSKSDLAFRSTFCDRKVITQELVITDPSGARTDFALSADQPGIRIEPSNGFTPAVVSVSVDPSAFANLRGTLSSNITITSTRAMNLINPVRALINLQEPDQRGTMVNVPGKLVDIMSDPQRNRYFVLRQDTDEVLVYDGTSYQQVASLRTGNTPTSMAVSFDRRYLLIGCDNSQIISVYDLETLEPSQPIRMPFGHYPRWVASSGNATLVACRNAGPKNTIDRVDFLSRTAVELPTLGIYENKIDVNTALVASPNGNSILVAEADGNLLLYNANVDTFTVSRKETTPPTGAIAASSYDQFVVGNKLYNSSLVPIKNLGASVGSSSGFQFYDDTALRSGAQNSSSPGVMERVNLSSGSSTRPTNIAEAPILGTVGSAFTRTIAIAPDRSSVVNLTTSGVTVLAWNYDASVAIPHIDSVVNAADGTQPVAPGGLIVVTGRDLSALNMASRDLPLPTALGESCLTVNGWPVPMLMVSSTEINAQLPSQADGNVTMVLHTPGGVSDNFNFTVLAAAPSIFRMSDGPATGLATVVRAANNQVVTPSNPIRGNDTLVIYLTGMGKVSPEVPDGQPAPSDPLSHPLIPPSVDISGVQIPVTFAGLTPGQIGVYQINVYVPTWAPHGMNQTLRITQGSFSTTLNVRVLEK